jgi:MOSC domain-containing protein YiiM
MPRPATAQATTDGIHIPPDQDFFAMPDSSIIEAIFVGQPKEITDAAGTWRSSIFRDRVSGPVAVHTLGLEGDQVAQSYHGGVEGAICVHLNDHYRFWNEHHGLDMRAGGVGENFTLEHITEDQVCAGDILRVGTALVQVSGPRVPCANQARRVGRPDWVKMTIRASRTGFYLRVLETGMVAPGDSWLLQERPNPEGTIPALNHCMYLEFDPAFAERTIRMPGLDDWWKDRLKQKAPAGPALDR